MCGCGLTRFYPLLKGRSGQVLASIFLGFIAGFAFPPFNLVPLFWLSFTGLFLLLCRAKTRKQAFFTGWAFAFGHLLLCLYWIAGALFVDIASFWWVLPFAVAGLPAVLAFFYGVATLAAWRYGFTRWCSPFFTALCWFAADMARAHLFTGFPWDIAGYVWGDCLSVLQSTYWIGIDGLSLLTLLFAFSPAVFFIGLSRRRSLCLFSLGIFLLGGLFAFGSYRLSTAKEVYVPDVRLRLVQPSTEQSMKWREDKRAQNLIDLMTLSFAEKSAEPITHYVWPETAMAYYLTEEPEVRREIASHMAKGSYLLTGSVRRQFVDGQVHYYNSLLAMDANGNLIAGYDKHHLVPFGEYIPFSSIVPLRAIAGMGADFTPGEGVRSLRVPMLPPFSPLVCYEAIFSGDVASGDDQPKLLVNVTNDAWYKGTIGPTQHFFIARVRAIEEGLPLVRVSNMGLSTVVDAYGRSRVRDDPKKAAFSDYKLPLDVESPKNFYGIQKDMALWLMVVVVLLICFQPFIPLKLR